MYHVHRRKRLVRPRKKISDQTAAVEVRNMKMPETFLIALKSSPKHTAMFPAEARTRGRLGVLVPDWLEVPQEGAFF